MESAGWPLYRLAGDSLSEGRPSRLTGGSPAGSGFLTARPKAPLRPSLAASELRAEGHGAPWAGAVSIREPKGGVVPPNSIREPKGGVVPPNSPRHRGASTSGSSAVDGTSKMSLRTRAAAGKTLKFAEDCLVTGHGGHGGGGGGGGGGGFGAGPQKELFASSDLSKV